LIKKKKGAMVINASEEPAFVRIHSTGRLYSQLNLPESGSIHFLFAAGEAEGRSMLTLEKPTVVSPSASCAHTPIPT
jgi:hypothetical protein